MLDAVIVATESLLGELGVEDITTTLIARRARCSVAAVYRFYPNREAVLVDLAERYRAMLEHLYGHLLVVATTRDPVEVADQVLDGLVAFVRSEPGFRTLWWSRLVDGRPLAGLRREFFLVIAARFQEILEPGRPAGEPPDPAFMVLVETADHLVGVAFRSDPQGDAGLLDATRRALRLQLIDLADRADRAAGTQLP
jgi:AcrR family transcriptional regulator